MNLLLIDVSGLIHRCYYAYPPLQRRDGVHVGAVAGVTGMLWRMLTHGVHRDIREMPTHIGVVFDSPGRTFRHELLPSYKGNRAPRDPNLSGQFDLVRRAVQAFGLRAIEQPGVEADDLIASYTDANSDGRTVIVSSDKDLMQLVGPGVVMVDDKNDRLIGTIDVAEKFSVVPDQMVDFLALVGDAADNIPGVPGVGAKTAAKLLQEFGSIAHILAPHRASKHESLNRAVARIVASEWHTFIARLLVRLDRRVKLEVPLSDLAWSGEIETGPVLDFCDEMELLSLRRTIERALEEAA